MVGLNAIVVGWIITMGLMCLDSGASDLPNFISPCQGTDPHLNECLQDEANRLIPILTKGVPEYQVPILDPLSISGIEVKSNHLNVVMKNVEIVGLSSTQVVELNVDLKNHTVHVKVIIPRLNIQGDYKMNGRILVLPIRGRGPANVTIHHGTFDIHTKYSVIDKNGIDHMRVDAFDVNFDIKRVYMNFENLFNGDQEASTHANTIINKDWHHVLRELAPAIKETISTIGQQITNGITDTVPYADLFGGKLP